MNGYYIDEYKFRSFPIGELAKICNVTRRMILNYEEHGIIIPAKTDKFSGYRYYDMTSVTRVRYILNLQKLGFSLDEICRYLNGDEDEAKRHLQKLIMIRENLDKQISTANALLTKEGEISIHRENMDSFDAIELTHVCHRFEDTYILIAEILEYVQKKGWQFADGGRRLMTACHFDENGIITPEVTALFSVMKPNEESRFHPACECLCINYRGAYSKLPEVRQALFDYAKKEGIETEKWVLTFYLTSPQSHLRKDNHVSQLFLPIKSTNQKEEP